MCNLLKEEFQRTLPKLQECWLFLSNVITPSSIIIGYLCNCSPCFHRIQAVSHSTFFGSSFERCDANVVFCFSMYMKRYIIHLALCCVHLGNKEFKFPRTFRIGSRGKFNVLYNEILKASLRPWTLIIFLTC